MKDRVLITGGSGYLGSILTEEFLNNGTSVTNVCDLTSNDLVELQNEGFVSIYSKPHRWGHVIKKNGLFGGFLMMLRVLRIILQKNLKMIKNVKFTSTQTRPKEIA